jgi:hypothetical protein
LGKAADRLAEDHVDDAQFISVVLTMGQTGRRETWPALRVIGQESTDRKTQALACYLLAKSLTSGDEAERDDDRRREAISLLERVEHDFAGLMVFNANLAEMAGDDLFAVKHLCIGAEAPEIVGRDAAGMEFKLSCVRMFPQERRLVQANAERPFAIVGVNCDEDDVLREVEESKQVVWRSWSDGRQGPISQQWRINAFPSIYLIDHLGVIRFKCEGVPDEKQLSGLLEQLLASAEKK